MEPGRTFDLVVALEVVEHIEDDAAAVAEWFARLRPGGELVLSTPAYQRRFGPMDELVGHHRRYEPPGLIALLSAAGFVDVSVRHYGAPLAYVIEPVRNVIARRRLDHHSGAVTLPAEVLAQRTGHSGRTLQPGSRAVGLAIELATAPVKRVQRRFPAWGPALIAHGRRRAG